MAASISIKNDQVSITAGDFKTAPHSTATQQDSAGRMQAQIPRNEGSMGSFKFSNCFSNWRLNSSNASGTSSHTYSTSRFQNELTDCFDFRLRVRRCCYASRSQDEDRHLDVGRADGSPAENAHPDRQGPPRPGSCPRCCRHSYLRRSCLAHQATSPDSLLYVMCFRHTLHTLVYAETNVDLDGLYSVATQTIFQQGLTSTGRERTRL